MTYEDYSYIISDLEITITDYTGSNQNIVIPKEINGLKVTKIGGYVFEGCSSLTHIA